LAVRVETQDFDAAAEVARLTRGRTDVGAVVTFTGLVRGEAGGAPISGLTLEHYPGMTEAELQRIEEEARGRFDILDCLIVHRFGELRPGDNIVLVICTSAHRQAAFEAASFLMDFLKSRAPFWKKETDAAGEGAWVDARSTDDAARERWDAPKTPAK
jgi:molybdopterin synthase catalytic subunit